MEKDIFLKYARFTNLKMKKYDVYAIGNALMDVYTKVENEKLVEINLKKGDMHLVDEEQSKRFFEGVKDNILKTGPGGSSVNVAAGVAMLGGSVAFCGVVGNDEQGRMFEDILVKEGVIANLAKSSKMTGNVISFITDDSERTFATHLGAALELKKEDVSEEDIIASKVLHIEAYQLEDPKLKEVCFHAMDVVKSNGVKVSIDLSDPALIMRNLEEFKKVVKDYADIVFANEEEAKAFTGLEPEEALHKIAEDAEDAVVKLGSKGSIIKNGEDVFKIEAVEANAIDTTGAGDSFAAGFLYGFCNELGIEKSGKLGSFLGSKVVEEIGTRIEQDVKEEIEQLK